MIDQAPDEPTTVHIGFDDEVVRVVADADEADATVEWGFGNTAGAVSVRFTPARTPVGPSVAPRAAAGLAFAAEHWGLAIPAYEPAVDVHR